MAKTTNFRELLTIRRKFPKARRSRVKLEYCAARLIARWRRSHFVHFCSSITHAVGAVATVVALLVAVAALFVAVETQKGEIEQREKDRIVRDWTIIAMSPQARGNIGQKDAVEHLVSEGVSLQSVNLRQAPMIEADLRGAHFWNARLEGANLQDADLRDADLTIARLRGAILRVRPESL